MSELTKNLIQVANDEHTNTLAAIEAGIGKIEEAEALAATLRSFGVPSARAAGFVSGGKYRAVEAAINVWVQTNTTAATDVIQALRDADLQVSHINLKDGETFGYIHLHGMDCKLSADSNVCIAVALHRHTEPAHG